MKNLDTLILSSALIGTFLLFVGVLNKSQNTVKDLSQLYKDGVTITR